jgi:hypothetical protein
MISFILGHIFSRVLDLSASARRSDYERDLEIFRLRHQRRILQRTHRHPPRLRRWEKRRLAILAAKLKAVTSSSRSR